MQKRILIEWSRSRGEGTKKGEICLFNAHTNHANSIQLKDTMTHTTYTQTHIITDRAKQNDTINVSLQKTNVHSMREKGRNASDTRECKRKPDGKNEKIDSEHFA